MKKIPVILEIIKNLLATPSGKFAAIACTIGLIVTIFIIYRSIKHIVVSTKKGGVAGFLGSVATVAVIIFVLFFHDTNKYDDATVKSTTKQSVVPVQTAPAQPTGDPLKDELLWPIGKFGYHEPPMELRHECINPITKKPWDDGRYRIDIHSDIYGDLEMQYNPVTGQRTLFTKGGGAPDKLLIISEDYPITLAEGLQDLKMSDSIARNFGK